MDKTCFAVLCTRRKQNNSFDYGYTLSVKRRSTELPSTSNMADKASASEESSIEATKSKKRKIGMFILQCFYIHFIFN